MADAEENQEPAPDEVGAETARDADDPDAPDKAEASADATDASAEEQRPKKHRKKKKRKKREAGQEPELRPARDAQGRDRPAFLLAFPHNPELERLIDAFEEGDYATVRREAPELAERTDDPEVRDAALELRRRIDPDPLARYLLLTGVGLLLFLIIWVYVKQVR